MSLLGQSSASDALAEAEELVEVVLPRPLVLELELDELKLDDELAEELTVVGWEQRTASGLSDPLIPSMIVSPSVARLTDALQPPGSVVRMVSAEGRVNSR